MIKLRICALLFTIAVIISSVNCDSYPLCPELSATSVQTVWSPYVNATFSAQAKDKKTSLPAQSASIKDSPDALALGRSIYFDSLAISNKDDKGGEHGTTNVTLFEIIHSDKFVNGDLTGIKVALTHDAGMNQYYIEQRHLGFNYTCNMVLEGIHVVKAVSVALDEVQTTENCSTPTSADLELAKWDAPKFALFPDAKTINQGRIDEYITNGGVSTSSDKEIKYTAASYQKQILNDIQFVVQRKQVDQKKSASRTLVNLHYADPDYKKVQLILQGGLYDQYKCHSAYSVKKGTVIEQISFQDEIV